MDSKLDQAIREFIKAINSDPRIKSLNKAEKEMESSEEVSFLASEKSRKNDEYFEVCRFFKEYSPEEIKARKALFTAKKNLDSHPLVKAYQECFVAVNSLFYQIDDAIFSAFKERVVCKHD